MSYRKSFGLLAGCGIAGFVVASCGSSSGGGDNGTITHKDAGMGAIVDAGTGDADAGASGPVDGTTGKPCKTDADCTSDGGPGLIKCSGTQTFTFTGVRVAVLPTPVCMGPLAGSSCDPLPATDPTGMQVHFCDGPDDPSLAPGVCLANTNPPAPGMGTCYPKCTYNLDGTAPTGCAGHDTCTTLGYLGDMTGAVTSGFGFCQGTCLQDSDCSDLGAGWVCQVDIGSCTKAKVTRKKAIGQACSLTRDQTAGNCNCAPPLAANSTTQSGYCTSACIVGTQPDVCPPGWVCDNLSSSLLPDGTTLTAENVGTAGFCVPLCPTGDGGTVAETGPGQPSDAASDAPSDGSADGSPVTPEASAPLSCPPNSTCQENTPLGAECLP